MLMDPMLTAFGTVQLPAPFATTKLCTAIIQRETFTAPIDIVPEPSAAYPTASQTDGLLRRRLNTWLLTDDIIGVTQALHACHGVDVLARHRNDDNGCVVQGLDLDYLLNSLREVLGRDWVEYHQCSTQCDDPCDQVGRSSHLTSYDRYCDENCDGDVRGFRFLAPPPLFFPQTPDIPTTSPRKPHDIPTVVLNCVGYPLIAALTAGAACTLCGPPAELQ